MDAGGGAVAREADMGGDGIRWGLDMARAAAERIVAQLAPACERIEVAGSVRRCRETVGDLEIVYVPRVEPRPDFDDFFAVRDVNLADEAIGKLERIGMWTRRANKLGRETFGPLIKLMRLEPYGLGVDLFAAGHANWWNYLVCRTGPRESNERIAAAAKARGWKWTPYGPGFESADGSRVHAVGSEREVFEFVGLRYDEPEFRR